MREPKLNGTTDAFVVTGVCFLSARGGSPNATEQFVTQSATRTLITLVLSIRDRRQRLPGRERRGRRLDHALQQISERLVCLAN